VTLRTAVETEPDRRPQELSHTPRVGRPADGGLCAASRLRRAARLGVVPAIPLRQVGANVLFRPSRFEFTPRWFRPRLPSAVMVAVLVAVRHRSARSN